MADYTELHKQVTTTRQAVQSLRERLHPDTEAFRRLIDERTDARVKAMPRDARFSKGQIWAEERDKLHREYARETPKLLQQLHAQRDTARQRLAETRESLRRVPRPGVSLTPEQRSNPLAPLLAETNQRLHLMELREQYAGVSAERWVADLKVARERGDTTREYFLDSGIDAVIEAIPATPGKGLQAIELRKRLRHEIDEMRDARIQPSDQENLAAFTEQIEAIEKDTRVLGSTVYAAQEVEHVAPMPARADAAVSA